MHRHDTDERERRHRTMPEPHNGTRRAVDFRSRQRHRPAAHEIPPPFVTMASSTWETYERYWAWGKEDYPHREAWRPVRRIVHSHVRLSALLDEAYARRHLEGLEPVIARCQALIDLAPRARAALPQDHRFEQDFVRWQDRAWGIPEQPHRPFRMPGHRGLTLLATIHEAQGDLDAVIAVCETATRIGWPGDWSVRIARCRHAVARQWHRRRT